MGSKKDSKSIEENVENLTIEDCENKIESLKKTVKELEKIKRRKKEISKLESKKKKVMHEIRKTHK